MPEQQCQFYHQYLIQTLPLSQQGVNMWWLNLTQMKSMLPQMTPYIVIVIIIITQHVLHADMD